MTDEYAEISFVTDESFEGRTHAELLALELPADERYLIEDLIPAGSIGTIAGVPETHKSFLAQAIAVRVAAAEGEVFGRRVLSGGRVGYVWQDDSEREEIERVRLFERAHPSPPDLSLWWFLNIGLALPDDLKRLRATVEEYRLDLLILDSFYSVVFGIDLKDKDAEQVFSALKREIADATGCTVLIVDHMPWATDQNRSRLRGYGGVHKGAAIRFGIYIDADGTKLSAEARGNNIKGFKKTPAYWDAEALELRLVESESASDEELDERVLDYISTHEWPATKEVVENVKGRAQSVRESLKRLERTGRATKRSSADLGRPGTGTHWKASSEALSQVVPATGTTSDHLGRQGTSDQGGGPGSPSPVGGTTHPGTTLGQPANEQAAFGDQAFCDHPVRWLARDGVRRCLTCDPPAFPAEIVDEESA